MTIEDGDPGGGSQRQLFGGLRRGPGHCFNGGSSTGNNPWVHIIIIIVIIIIIIIVIIISPIFSLKWRTWGNTTRCFFCQG
jgi:hypothetical protein